MVCSLRIFWPKIRVMFQAASLRNNSLHLRFGFLMAVKKELHQNNCQLCFKFYFLKYVNDNFN